MGLTKKQFISRLRSSKHSFCQFLHLRQDIRPLFSIAAKL